MRLMFLLVKRNKSYKNLVLTFEKKKQIVDSKLSKTLRIGHTSSKTEPL